MSSFNVGGNSGYNYGKNDAWANSANKEIGRREKAHGKNHHIEIDTGNQVSIGKRDKVHGKTGFDRLG